METSTFRCPPCGDVERRSVHVVVVGRINIIFKISKLKNVVQPDMKSSGRADQTDFYKLDFFSL